MFKLVEKIKMKHIRQLEPILPRLNNPTEPKVPVIYDIAVILIVSDKTSEEIKNEIDDLEKEEFNELSNKITELVSSLEDNKKK